MGVLDGITATHVDQAIKYIGKYGNPQGKHDIFSVDVAGGLYLAIVKDGKRIGIREILRVAYCFSTNEPLNENGEFEKKQLKLLYGTVSPSTNSQHARDHLIKLKFKVRDYENVLLFRLSQSYTTGITEKELYEATRGIWKININHACTIKYAVAVADGIVREVYEIDSWHIAGTTKYETRPDLNKENSKRKEFIGKIAVGEVRKLIGCEIGFRGSNPVCYKSLNKLINVESEGEKPEREKIMESKELELLKQIGQIILFGPPGTGKTFRAKEIVKELLGIEKDKKLPKDSKYWDIVQFHPSYNYEDFVRGVQVKTTKGEGQVVYETLNKTFGAMCEVAEEEYEKAEKEKRDPQKYALIIDEINRANVSAVLGELIYALEYRDEEIKTPYEVNDKQGIIIPSNLYIIGTMNTADRTIGQIDYAVRRRFAFVPCSSDKSVITNKKAGNFFDDVDDVFKHTSLDFDKEDVRIGHSYFLADDDNKLANKIIYQVIPILREYVKDGILTSSAKEFINEIEKNSKKLLNGRDNPDPILPDGRGRQWFRWKHKDDDKYTFTEMVGHAAREIIADFIRRNPDKSIEFFQGEIKGPHKRVVSLKDGEIANGGDEKKKKKKRYFTESPVDLGNTKVVISNQFGTRLKEDNTEAPQWRDFKYDMAQHGYSIGQCYIVNIGEDERRAWKHCYDFGFIAAGGGKKPNYHTAMKGYKKGDIVFIYLAGSGVVDSDKGVICYGEVVSEAQLVSKFEIPKGGLLANCVVDNDKTYRNKFPTAFEDPDSDYPDMAVGVEWLTNPIQAFKISSAPQGGSGGYIQNFPKEDMAKLQKEFNLDKESK